tara:strand:- start:4651 stop:5220 length:570 start_codon:yes stop_codon:yes gene_type:complete
MKGLFLLPIFLLSIVSCSSEQQESVTSGACVIDTGSFPVGFNAYVVPEGNHPSYPPFCSPVPAGLLNIVIDLFSFELRDQLIAIKVVKIEHNEEQEALFMPPTKYHNGSIPIMISLEPRSKYKILLLDGGSDKDITASLVSIPIETRRKGDYVHTGAAGSVYGFLFILLGIIGTIILVYRYLFNRSFSK